ncbi:MAG: glycosyltransferase family 39 protein, partial [Pirellulaceae bacterium]|nr:glycosyltransferase family 39 protein [Pirellulaceae bacterium]
MTDRQLRWIPWALVSVGVLLRWPAMSGALWFDEIWLLSNVGHQTLAETLTTFKSDNNHPLYSILSWFGVHGFGGGAASLRLVALVFGVLSIAAAYRLASLLLPQRMAILLSVGLALSSHHIAFSTNARGYTALLFFSLNACFWFHHAVHGERRGAWWRCSLALALASFV